MSAAYAPALSGHAGSTACATATTSRDLRDRRSFVVGVVIGAVVGAPGWRVWSLQRVFFFGLANPSAWPPPDVVDPAKEDPLRSLTPSLALTLLAITSPALAQGTDLSLGWQRDVGAAGLRPAAIACARDRVFVLSEHVLRSGGEEYPTTFRIWSRDGVIEAAPPPPGTSPSQVSVTPDGHLFATHYAYDPLSAQPTRIAHWDGTSWAVLDLVSPDGAPLHTAVNGILALDAEHVYLVASAGTIARLEGTRFVAYSAGTWRDLESIAGRDPRDLYVSVAGAAPLHWDGTSFSPVTVDGPTTSVFMTARGALWAFTEYAWRERTPSGWVVPALASEEDRLVHLTRPDVMFDSRVGLVLGSGATLAVQFESGWVRTLLSWFPDQGCATDSELVLMTRGREEFGGARPEIHEPGDIFYWPL